MRIAPLTVLLAAVGLGCASTPNGAATATPAPVPTGPLRSQEAAVPDYLDPRISLPQSLAATSVTTAAPADDVWYAVRVAYDSLHIPLNVYDERQHLIGNQGLAARQRLAGTRLSKFFDCGNSQIGPNADAYDVLLAHVTYVGVNPQGMTVITTRTAAAARPATYSQSYSRCFPTGELDKRFFEIVQRTLRGEH